MLQTRAGDQRLHEIRLTELLSFEERLVLGEALDHIYRFVMVTGVEMDRGSLGRSSEKFRFEVMLELQVLMPVS